MIYLINNNNPKLILHLTLNPNQNENQLPSRFMVKVLVLYIYTLYFMKSTTQVQKASQFIIWHPIVFPPDKNPPN